MMRSTSAGGWRAALLLPAALLLLAVPSTGRTAAASPEVETAVFAVG